VFRTINAHENLGQKFVLLASIRVVALKNKSSKSIYIAHVPCQSVHMHITNISWNLEMLVFEERGKPEYGENLSEQGREPTTNSTHI